MIELGDKVKCVISGFVGVVTSHATHLNGCDRVWVSPPTDKDGKLIDGSWFDTIQLEVVEKSVVKKAVVSIETKPGGPPSRIK